MKVVKKGRKKLWSKRLKCIGRENRGCGATLLVSQTDLYEIIKNMDRFAGDVEMVELTVFCCPECGEETNIGDCRPNKIKPLGKKPTMKEKKIFKKLLARSNRSVG